MIIFGSFLPSLLVGFNHHQLYSSVGADIVMESISLIDPLARLRRNLVLHLVSNRGEWATVNVKR
jgi:hypothetical protein